MNVNRLITAMNSAFGVHRRLSSSFVRWKCFRSYSLEHDSAALQNLLFLFSRLPSNYCIAMTLVDQLSLKMMVASNSLSSAPIE